MGPVTTVAPLALGAACYLAPSVIAYARAVPDTWAIVMWNLFAGWTVVGWAWALSRALRRPPVSPGQLAPARAPLTWQGRWASRPGLLPARPGQQPPLPPPGATGRALRLCAPPRPDHAPGRPGTGPGGPA